MSSGGNRTVGPVAVVDVLLALALAVGAAAWFLWIAAGPTAQGVLTGEEASVADRDALALALHWQPSVWSTNAGAQLFYAVTGHVTGLPRGLHALLPAHGEGARLGPARPAGVVVARRRLGCGPTAATLGAVLVVLVPGVTSLAWVAIETPLDAVAGMAALYLATSPTVVVAAGRRARGGVGVAVHGRPGVGVRGRGRSARPRPATHRRAARRRGDRGGGRRRGPPARLVAQRRGRGHRGRARRDRARRRRHTVGGDRVLRGALRLVLLLRHGHPGPRRRRARRGARRGHPGGGDRPLPRGVAVAARRRGLRRALRDLERRARRAADRCPRGRRRPAGRGRGRRARPPAAGVDDGARRRGSGRGGGTDGGGPGRLARGTSPGASGS